MHVFSCFLEFAHRNFHFHVLWQHLINHAHHLAVDELLGNAVLRIVLVSLGLSSILVVVQYPIEHYARMVSLLVPHHSDQAHQRVHIPTAVVLPFDEDVSVIAEPNLVSVSQAL